LPPSDAQPRILITGGAGFVGSNLACALQRRHPEVEVVAFDSLRRRGSELNLPRLREAGVQFIHGDVRLPEDLDRVGPVGVILECSAEPSVLAGQGAERAFVVQTNLLGTVNCLEAALRHRARLVFLSTSRVYPVEALNQLPFVEEESRYQIRPAAGTSGASERGIDVGFTLEGARTLYGATKLASELLIEEYARAHGLEAVVNRCGVIAGPWQFGRIDQGVAAYWLLRHRLGGALSYIGFGGGGKQVRDFLHVDDLIELLELQLARFEEVRGRTFNVGGGAGNALSLMEMTRLCRDLTGRDVRPGHEPQTRPGDVRAYVTDNRRVEEALGWKPRRSCRQIFEDIDRWIAERGDVLRWTLE
jgi:CDP-paratose 2-epimerase